jgi:hypothetical protein
MAEEFFEAGIAEVPPEFCLFLGTRIWRASAGWQFLARASVRGRACAKTRQPKRLQGRVAEFAFRRGSNGALGAVAFDGEGPAAPGQGEIAGRLENVSHDQA